ncbi:MAG: EamA family transporter [Bryobacteraceae bacterium]
MKARARVQVLGAALLFSTGGAGIKALPLTNWQVASLRSLIAAVAILILLPETRRNWSRGTVLVALAYSAMLVLFVTANKLTTSANTIFLQATGPLYLLFLGPLILNERTRRSDYLFLAVMAVGMALFFVGDQAPQRTAPQPLLGNILAAISGFAWAATMVGLRWFAKKGQGSMNTVALGNIVTFAVCLAPALSAPLVVSVSSWLILAYLGIFQLTVGYLLLSYGVRHLPALEASMLVLLEPALNPIWTWLLHGEHVSALAIAGGLCVLGSTAGRMIAEKAQQPADGVA